MTPGDQLPSDSAMPSSPIRAPGGLVLAPFRAWRYADTADNRLARLLCPPYDVIDADRQTDLENADPHNAVHLILPRDDESGPDSRYRRAARTLAAWRTDGVLTRDPEPAIYVYEMASAEATTRGLIGALTLADPGAGIVLPHENTMPGPVADRLALTAATEANLEPIYLVYDGARTAGEIVAGVDTADPLGTATTPDGITHRLWAITAPDLLRTFADELYPQRALIADGHHRYATYLATQDERHRRGDGAGPWDAGLTYLVDAGRFGPHVEPIHRVVPGIALLDAIDRAAHDFTVTEIAGPADAALEVLDTIDRDETAFLVSDGTDWRLLRRAGAASAVTGNPLVQLDVTALHRLLIEQLWEMDEDLVEYEHDLGSLIARARTTHGVAVLLRASTVEQVAAVAAAGDRMPRKSTLFTPKPADGLVFRTFDDT
jgi:uncharacterized protein (DUF1015 family)